MADRATSEGMEVATFDDYVKSPLNASTKPQTAPVAEPKVEVEEPVIEVPVQPTTEKSSVVEKQSEAPKVSEAEKKARDSGWRPLAEYTGDPRKWVSAEVWVANQPLVDQVRGYKKQLRETQRQVAVFGDHYRKVHEAAYKQAYETLMAQRDQAILSADTETVRAIDQKIEAARKEEIQTRPELPPAIDPAAKAWIDAHPEIMNDPKLKLEAVAQDNLLMQMNPEMDIEERLERVEQRLHILYPERFENQRRTFKPQVDSGAPSASNGGGKRRYSVQDLSAEERQVHDMLVRTKQITSEQYLKDLEEIGAFNEK